MPGNRRAPRAGAAAVVLALLIGPPVPAEEAEGGLDELAWLVGSWIGSDGQVASEEVWLAAKGGVMLGLHRDVGPSGRAFFEYLRIEERDDLLVYVAQPLGASATEFPAAEVTSASAVFENLEHDFPQRISYRLDDSQVLVVRAEAEAEGGSKALEWRWTREP